METLIICVLVVLTVWCILLTLSVQQQMRFNRTVVETIKTLRILIEQLREE